MATQRQHRRGDRTACEALTPAAAEYIFDTTLNTIRVGSGAKLGGYLLKRWGEAFKIRPAQITADQNDYAPVDATTAALTFATYGEQVNIRSDALRNITGLAGGAVNKKGTFTNEGSFNIVLKHQSASSLAANRFDFGSDDVVLMPGGSVTLHYDDTASRWRPAGWREKIFRVAEEMLQSGSITPSQITANQNDYAPADSVTAALTFVRATVIRASSDASRNITGLVDPRPGAIKKFVNVGANNIVFKNADAGSTAANRFDMGADVTIASRQSVSFIYDGTLARWVLLASTAGAAVAAGAVTAQTLGSTALGQFIGMVNGTISHSRAGNAETVAIKTLAGTDPTASDPVLVVFRNATAGTGDFVVRTISAALSFTISSGSSMGFTNGVAGRIWWTLIDTGGGVVLGGINCLSGTNIYPLAGWGIISTTAEGGAGAADSAQVMYSAAAQASKPYVIIGYSTWESGLAAAGTWNTAPSRVQLMGPGVPLPGQQVQSARSVSGSAATGTTQIPLDDTIPQNTEGDQYFSQAIAPTSAANVIEVDAKVQAGVSAAITITTALFQDSTANALAAFSSTFGGVNYEMPLSLTHAFLAGTTSSTTLKLRLGSASAGTLTVNGNGGSRQLGGVFPSYLKLNELMA